jgi:hypothetical protein
LSCHQVHHSQIGKKHEDLQDLCHLLLHTIQKLKKVLIIEGVRENWTPKPIRIREQNISFLASLNLQNAVLANAFVIKDIPYFWKKGQN